MAEPLEHEDEILAACALRFHGYRYAEDTGFDMAAARDECERTNRYDHLSVAEQMAVLFFIQRTVRWGEQGVVLPRHSSLFRAYRELFLIRRCPLRTGSGATIRASVGGADSNHRPHGTSRWCAPSTRTLTIATSGPRSRRRRDIHFVKEEHP